MNSIVNILQQSAFFGEFQLIYMRSFVTRRMPICIIRQKHVGHESRRRERERELSAFTRRFHRRDARFINALCDCAPHIGGLLVRSPTTTTMSFSPAGPCPLFIRSWLESLFACEKGVEAEPSGCTVSIGWAGIAARRSQICFSTARIYSNLQRLGTPRFRKKKRGPRAALLFLLSFPFFFPQKERKFASASFGPFYALVD